jgi:hypothetical protein
MSDGFLLTSKFATASNMRRMITAPSSVWSQIPLLVMQWVGDRRSWVLGSARNTYSKDHSLPTTAFIFVYCPLRR